MWLKRDGYKGDDKVIACHTCNWKNKECNEEPCTLCKSNSDSTEDYYNAEWIEDNKSAVKDKAGKPNMSLVLPRALLALVRTREYGLIKYPDANNWRSVPKQDWYAAAARHLLKIQMGEELDEESGLPHVWHALCNIAYACEAEHYGDEWADGRLDE